MPINYRYIIKLWLCCSHDVIWHGHRVMKFTDRTTCLFLRLMEIWLKFIARICVCWRSCFLITRHSTTMLNHLFSMCWRSSMIPGIMLLDISRRQVLSSIETCRFNLYHWLLLWSFLQTFHFSYFFAILTTSTSFSFKVNIFPY